MEVEWEVVNSGLSSHGIDTYYLPIVGELSRLIDDLAGIASQAGPKPIAFFLPTAWVRKKIVVIAGVSVA